MDRAGFCPSLSSRFSPDEFASTGYCPRRKRALWGEVHDSNCFALGGVSGHAGLFGSARDVGLLVSELLACYEGAGSGMFATRRIREMFDYLNPVAGSTWRLGFDSPSPRNSSAGELFSRHSVGHLGFTGTSFWLDLDARLMVILLTNRVALRPRSAALKKFRPVIHDLAYRAAVPERK